MKRIELQNGQKLLSKRTLRATCFSVNSNGGFGGGHNYYYVLERMDDLLLRADTNGIIKVKLVDGSRKAINLGWCDHLAEMNVVEITATRVRWNSNFREHDVDFREGMAFVEYFAVGESPDLDEVSVSRTRSASDIQTDGCKSIYKSPYFDND